MQRQDVIALALSLASLFAASRASSADNARELSLFGSLDHISLTNVSTTDASVAKSESGGKAGLRVVTGHKADWPGIALPAPKGHWDLSPYWQIVLSVKNAGANSVTVSCRADNPGADGQDHCANGDVTLAPGQSGNLYVELKRTSNDQLGGKLFGMRGYPVALGGPRTIEPANVTQLLVFVAKPAEDHVFEVSDIHAAGHSS